jgi:sugar lactone lactonase YvrE
MRRIYYPILLLISCCPAFAQSLSINLISSGSCAGAQLKVNANFKPAIIVWRLNGTIINTTYATWSKSAVTVAGSSSGVSGSSSSLLDFPFGLYVDANDTIYVADFLNSRVQKWSPGATNGITIAGTGNTGTSDTELYYAANVFLDASGNMFVSDYLNNRIQKFSNGSKHGVTVAGIGDGRGGGNDSLLDLPTSAFVDKNDTIYICDGNNNRVVRWVPGADTGILVAGLGYGSGAKNLDQPNGVYMDTSRHVFIADTYNNRIQRWTVGDSLGMTVAGQSSFNTGKGLDSFADPTGVYVDGNGNIYVADAGNNRITQWGSHSTVKLVGSSLCDTGSSDSLLNYPTNLFLDTKGNLFVADAGNNRIQKFTDTINNILNATAGGEYTVTVFTFDGRSLTDSVRIYPNDTPTVNLIAYPGDTACQHSIIRIVAGLTHTQYPVTYRWLKNGLTLGTIDSVYTPSSRVTGDSIVCIISTTNPCAATVTDTSKSLILTILPDTTPSITIGGNTSGPVGSTIHLTAGIIGATAGYNIHWYNNGVIFATTSVDSLSYVKSSGTDSITAVIFPTTGCYDSAVSNSWIVQVGVSVSAINGLRDAISIYPNPFKNDIEITGMVAGDVINMYDLYGKKIISRFIANKDGKNRIHFSALQAGLYLVRISDKFGNLKANIPLMNNN